MNLDDYTPPLALVGDSKLIAVVCAHCQSDSVYFWPATQNQTVVCTKCQRITAINFK